MAILYKSDPARGLEWKKLLSERRPDLKFYVWPEAHDPDEIRILALWTRVEGMFERYRNADLILSTGAGIDQFDLTDIPPHVPLVRMVEPGILARMTEYVMLGILTLHRHGLEYRQDQRAEIWSQIPIVPASRRRIGVMGLGHIGTAVCERLRQFGFPFCGWSRSPHRIDGITCYAGRDSLPEFVAQADILVCLLPLTDETRGIIDAKLLSWLPNGAGLVNAGRGPHVVTDDLAAALDSGRMSGAVLDVTDPEPLPPGHPFWHHPRVMLTPHIASMTDPSGAVDFVLETIDRHRQGRPLRGLVDRSRGY